jgi:hypothetical protein
MWKGIIRQYPDFYHFANEDHIVTLHEGNTPLIPVPRLASKIKPGISVYLKYEGLSPGQLKQGLIPSYARPLETPPHLLRRMRQGLA